jgi:SAM-dependent methyltransferase
MMEVIAQEILTHQSNLDESSGYSLAGSFTRDLIASKVWLLTELARIAPQVGTIYVLGSWYGNLGVLLALDPIIKYKQLINVETNLKMLDASQSILDRVGAKNVKYMFKDANDLNYQQLGKDGVVINTSLTDMDGQEWFDHIPAGTLVVMQSRDHDPGNAAHSTQDIIDRFPLSEIVYDGELKLHDPETEYTRYMVIGIR